jgi:hypothetical protein
MTDLREFIKKLGDNAPAFFGTSEATVKRWLKTGSLPFKATQKILLMLEASGVIGNKITDVTVKPSVGLTEISYEKIEPGVPEVDPVTKLPTDLRRGNFVMQGRPPDFIEEDPREQNFGANLTRPGRAPQPLPPMKIKKVNGQDVAYVDNHPKTPTAMPPTMPQGAGWSNPLDHAQPKKTT